MNSSARSRFLDSDAPPVTIEITSRQVTIAVAQAFLPAVASAKAGRPAEDLRGWASEPLPAGAVVPSLTARNIADEGAVIDALRRAIDRAGVRVKRAALIVPDLAAKVSLVPFETVPERHSDLVELISWQVRKSAPFRIEDAQVSFAPGAPHGEAGRTFIVTLARQDVVRQYEDVCAAAGVQAGIVDLTSFNVINAVLARGQVSSGDWLLVNASEESQTLAIMRGDTLVFFRSRPVEGTETLPDLVHQTAMYYEDRLQGTGFQRVMLAGGAAGSDETVRRSLSDRLRAPIETIDQREVAAAARVPDRAIAANLSTRPFYNERRVHLAAAIVALIVVAFTAWNVARLVTLSSQRTELRTQIEQDVQISADLRRRAEALERTVDTAALMSVAASAREANEIIDRRTFSWTTFFNRLEETLPPGVMLASVAPQIENGEVILAMAVIARRAEDVDDFMERLEASGAFRDVLNTSETVDADGLHRASLRGLYR